MPARVRFAAASRATLTRQHWRQPSAQTGETALLCRDGAVALVGLMHRTLGPALLPLLEKDLKPALVTTLQQECARNPQQPPPPPSRLVRGAKQPGAAPQQARGRRAALGSRGLGIRRRPWLYEAADVIRAGPRCAGRLS